jgi:hypothetical protein
MRERHFRRAQILSVAFGVSCFLISLLGGTLQNAFLARAGIVGFLLALAAVIIAGILAARSVR